MDKKREEGIEKLWLIRRLDWGKMRQRVYSKSLTISTLHSAIMDNNPPYFGTIEDVSTPTFMVLFNNGIVKLKDGEGYRFSSNIKNEKHLRNVIKTLGINDNNAALIVTKWRKHLVVSPRELMRILKGERKQSNPLFIKQILSALDLKIEDVV